MIPGFEKLVEERIKKAQQEGCFDDLEGSHKPLKLDNMNVPDDFRLAHKILKNAGFLPPEVELKKEITNTEQLLETAKIDSPKRVKIQKKLNYLLTKLSTARGDQPSSTMLSGVYQNSIIKKIS